LKSAMRVLGAVLVLSVMTGCGPDEPKPSHAGYASNQNDIVLRGEDFVDPIDPSRGNAYSYPWECQPNLYGFTAPPPAGFTYPAEFSATSGLIMAFPSWACIYPEWAQIAKHAIGHTNVTILVDAAHQSGAESCLKHSGVTAAQLSQITFINMPINSMWVRDFGPEFLKAPNGATHIVDMSYKPQLANTCNNPGKTLSDDVTGTTLAALWGIPFSRPQVRHEGGNFLSDGQGRCFRSQKIPEQVNCFSSWCYTSQQLDSVLGSHFNCQVVALQSPANAVAAGQAGGVIDHIDMFMSVIAPNTILVGQYAAGDDPDNATILDQNAAVLETLGYRVVRIPMPKPYCSLAETGYGKESQIGICGQANQQANVRVWATYANSIRVGNLMLVPVFRWVPAQYSAIIQAQEAQALAIYQAELDLAFGAGAVTVVPVISDTLIASHGSLHCITMTY
jgi:agmatine/peptidylarginine deiminase